MSALAVPGLVSSVLHAKWLPAKIVPVMTYLYDHLVVRVVLLIVGVCVKKMTSNLDIRKGCSSQYSL